MKRIFSTIAGGICLIGAFSAQAAEKHVGEVVFVRGEATVTRLEEKIAPKDLKFGDPIYPLDSLQTGDGDLKILFNDKTVLSLAPRSKVLVTEHVYKPTQGIRRSIFDILEGTVRTIIDQAASLDVNDVQIQTPTAVAGIRGTDVGTKVLGKSTTFLCFDGQFEAFFKENPGQKIMVSKGQFTEIRGATPTSPAAIPARLNKEFSAQLQAPPLKEVLRQPGGENLKGEPEGRKPGAPPPPPGREGPGDGPPSLTGPPRPPPPPPPPILPGGTTATPPGAGPVRVPVTFP